MAKIQRQVVSSYKSKWNGDQITVSVIGSAHVVEIINNESHVDTSDDEEKAPRIQSKKIDKATRVARIKTLLSEDKTRGEIKSIMYKEDMYKNNPNPASAFAGDWNGI